MSVLALNHCARGLSYACFKVYRLLSLLLLPLLLLFLALPAQASLVIKGTRVIYNADSKGATVEISNTDDFPNIMQAWIDTDPENKSPENAKAPFIITPAIARLDPKSSQTLRIIYTGDELPKDRESVFYLNVLQIPAQNSANASANQLQFMLLSQIKLFYRPSISNSSAIDTKNKLSFSVKSPEGTDWSIEAKNAGAYYASLSNAQLIADGKEIPLQAEMLAPYSEQVWHPVKSSPLPAGKLMLKTWLINDYGGREEVTYEISR